MATQGDVGASEIITPETGCPVVWSARFEADVAALSEALKRNAENVAQIESIITRLNSQLSENQKEITSQLTALRSKQLSSQLTHMRSLDESLKDHLDGRSTRMYGR